MKSQLKGAVSPCSFTHLLFIAFLLATVLGSSTLVADTDEFTPGEVLIRFAVTANELQISAFESEYGLTLLHDFGRIRMRHYKLPENISVQEAVEQFTRSPIVKLAEPNYLRRIEALPTDPHFSEQWALHNIGQVVNGVTGPPDIDIEWPEALELFRPAGEVIVAVIDSGVALDHPDIFPNRWLNSGETNFTNGIDDDGNGYIDDRIGWDYSDNDNAPLDENGHGTLAASIIGATIDNAAGSVGVNPYVKIMALRVLNQLGTTQGGLIDVVTFILATDYAADNGARIINYSIGGPVSSTFEYDQIQWLDTRGILLVASAGNDSTNNDTSGLPNYPSSYPANNIIAVAAVDRTGNLANFSNFGAISVDLAAPGTDIFGADIAQTNVFFENFENGAPGWSQASNTPLIWSLYVDPFSFNTWLTDSIDPALFSPVPYQPNTDSWAMTPPIDLRSGVGARLEYDIVHEFEYLFDGLIVEVSTDDGASWKFLDMHTGLGANLGAGQRASVDLSGYAGHIIRVRFNLLADSTNQFDGVYIDNVKISQFAVFFYDGSQYQFNSGTSFAAPLVSGVAALLMAQRPDLTHRQIRQLILENVDITPELTGQVATGGRLNARNALASAIALSDTSVNLSGTVQTAGGTGLCAMVLASGKFMFSCNPNGPFSLTGLSRANNDTVKRQIYVDGFFPEVDVLSDSNSANVVMNRAGTCPSYNPPSVAGVPPHSAGKRIDISGSILLQNTQTPICAMVLANGQYMFSCDGSGSYALNIPLDNNGQFKLQVYADGFAPVTQTFDEFQPINDVRMAQAVECQ